MKAPPAKPRVSVILPVRDAAATLQRAIGSVAAQDFADWELLVVDDGSGDGSRGLAAEWRRRDRRVRPVSLDGRHGIVAALREGCRQARGELWARMDADDWSAPRRLGLQVAALEADASLAAVACRVRLAGALGEGMRRYVEWTNSLATPEAIARERFIESPLVHPSVMMRRAACEAAGGYREVAWPEDHDLWLRMLEGGMRLGRVAEELLEWTDRANRLTRADGRYGVRPVWEMKAHYLARLPGVSGRGIAICGAGPLGKRLLRSLQARRVAVHGVFDVHPRRVGGRIHGVPVWGPADFGVRGRDAILVSAVGVAGGRQRVRALAAAAGYREGEDFWCVC